MHKPTKIIRMFFKNSRKFCRFLAITLGALVGFCLAKWLGLFLGIILAYIIENSLYKAIQKQIS